jgi:hypothetical protein
MNQQQRDLDKGMNMDMQLNHEQQIQCSRPSSTYVVEESCTKMNLRVEKADIGNESVSKRVSASNSSARKMVELKYVTMLCHSLQVACTVLRTMVVPVVAMIKVHNMNVECVEDNNRCDNRAKVVGTKYTKPMIGEQSDLGLREGSARAVNMLTEMWSKRESSLGEELSWKMAIMRRQDELLSGNGATTVQIPQPTPSSRSKPSRSTPW